MPSQTMEPLKRTELGPSATSMRPTKVALLAASVSEPLASLITRSPRTPLPVNETVVSVLFPSSLTVP